MLSRRTTCTALQMVAASMARWRAGVVVGHSSASINSCLLESRCTFSLSSVRWTASPASRSRTGSTPFSSSGPKKQRTQAPNSKQNASTTTQKRTSAREAMQTSQLRGGFNRMVREKGLYTSIFTYATGESVTLLLTYFLYFNVLGTGDIATWLQYANIGTSVLDSGVTVFGYKLTLRLLADYIIVNVVWAPLRPLHIRLCDSLIAVVSGVLSKTSLGMRLEKKRSIPKAPTTKPLESARAESAKKPPPRS